MVLVGCRMTFDVSDGLGQSLTSSLSALAVANSPVGANATRCWGGSYDRKNVVNFWQYIVCLIYPRTVSFSSLETMIDLFHCSPSVSNI